VCPSEPHRQALTASVAQHACDKFPVSGTCPLPRDCVGQGRRDTPSRQRPPNPFFQLRN